MLNTRICSRSSPFYLSLVVSFNYSLSGRLAHVSVVVVLFHLERFGPLIRAHAKSKS